MKRDGGARRYLVADEHDDDVGVGVIAQLVQPALHAVEGVLLGDIVHEKGSHRAAVVAKGVM